MPKGSEKLTNARKEEIVNACASLYETMGFKDITIRDIGEKTSFTRTSFIIIFRQKKKYFWHFCSGNTRRGSLIWRRSFISMNLCQPESLPMSLPSHWKGVGQC